MCFSDDEDDCFARFLESEVSSVEENEQTKELETKKRRIEKDETKDIEEKDEDRSGHILNIPTEVFRRYILKFLSSEDLLSCSLVCKFLNFAASDESLWRRLYCIRWGLTPPTRKLRESGWKKIYIDRDAQEMIKLVRNCPSDFKEYYIQMQAAKRTQAPLDDDGIILEEKTVLEQVSLWKKSKGFTDKVVTGHICQGTLTECTYHQIDDAFICKETGYVHICDDNCIKLRDTNGGVMVCTVSGLCSSYALHYDKSIDFEL